MKKIKSLICSFSGFFALIGIANAITPAEDYQAIDVYGEDPRAVELSEICASGMDPRNEFETFSEICASGMDPRNEFETYSEICASGMDPRNEFETFSEICASGMDPR